MELKPVGKLGMVKRKQFLQKRDISRSHEVNIFNFKVILFNKEKKNRSFKFLINNDKSIMSNFVKVDKNTDV
jgi:hypothetical protein